jgi:hypothetical protein
MNRRPMNTPRLNQKDGGWFWRAKVSLLYFLLMKQKQRNIREREKKIHLGYTKNPKPICAVFPFGFNRSLRHTNTRKRKKEKYEDYTIKWRKWLHRW